MTKFINELTNLFNYLKNNKEYVFDTHYNFPDVIIYQLEEW